MLFNAINNLRDEANITVLPFHRMEKSGSDKENAHVPGGIPRLEAADLERIVDSIVRSLRSGRPADLPGLGTINPDKEWTFLPEPGALRVVRDTETR